MLNKCMKNGHDNKTDNFNERRYIYYERTNFRSFGSG